MTKITRGTVIGLAFITACIRRQAPLVPPAPAVVGSARPASTEQTRAPSTPAQKPTLAKAADSTVAMDSASARRTAKQASDLFSDSLAAAADSAPSWDIDVHSYESTARVEYYVHYFSGPAKERIEARLERGTRYEAMIRATMRAGGLPEDMYYLALVESGFDQNAYSRAAAVGMWQFMTSTARDMGLRVDWWVDERRDPVKSTVAAVRFIKDLREQFGSLYLAAAAYNGGPVRIARGLTRYADALEGTSGDDLFFALAETDYLRSETRDYVPQLIAVALIGKEPGRYGMKVDAQPPLVYDSVKVGPETPLAAIAHAAGVTVPAILDLNPQILRGITPPQDSFVVRIPPRGSAGFDAAFASLPQSELLGIRTVVSKKSETFGSIATREGITPLQLSQYNPKARVLKSGNLLPGQSLLVPTAAVASAGRAVPDPSIERYGSSRGTTTHVVKPGETLASVAKRYHTTSAQLMKANGLRRALILPGQVLVVGKGGKGATVAKVAKKTGTTRGG